MSELRTSEIGHLLLKIEKPENGVGGQASFLDTGEEYILPISRMRYTMFINEIPKVVLSVGGGVSVYNSEDDVHPEVVLNELNGNEKSLLKCSIVEYGNDLLEYMRIKPSLDGGVPDYELVIFKGYIVDGGVNHASGWPGNTDCSFTCLGLSACLLSYPGSMYIETQLGHVVAALRDQDKNINLDNALASGNYLFDLSQNLESVAAETLGMSIVRRLAALVKAVRCACSTDALRAYMQVAATDNSKCDSNVLNAFGGRWTLNKNLDINDGSPTLQTGYSKSLIQAMLNTLSGGSVYDAIRMCLTSFQFSLELVPRWTCDKENDFKTEIKPVTVWRRDESRTVRIGSKDMLSFSAARNALAAVNTPDIVIVRFPPVYHGTDSYGDAVTSPGIRGAAAKDPAMNEKLRAFVANGSALMDEQDLESYRVTQIDMPNWFAILPGQLDSAGAGDSGTADKQHTLADDIAQIVLQQQYRRHDNAVVRLSPRVRFGHDSTLGRLEDKLGDRAYIEPGRNMPTCYGRIEGIIYDYSVSYDSARVEYTLNLSRVMYGDDNEGTLNVDNPIYEEEEK